MRVTAFHRGCVSTPYPDENEQCYCSKSTAAEVFGLPHSATSNCLMIGDNHLYTSVVLASHTDASCSVVTNTTTLAHQGRRGGVHLITGCTHQRHSHSAVKSTAVAPTTH